LHNLVRRTKNPTLAFHRQKVGYLIKKRQVIRAGLGKAGWLLQGDRHHDNPNHHPSRLAGVDAGGPWFSTRSLVG
jgi:hypothetical protein